MTRRRLTDAERFYMTFKECTCGSPDNARHRLMLIWQQGSEPPRHSGYYTECGEATLREAISDLRVDQRPTILVRVKPSPELIALADKIGASVQ